MELKLHLSGSVEPLSNYLDNFLRIKKSILLEIDTYQRAIIAKNFSDEHSVIRFASISFEDANLSIVSDSGEQERGEERVKIGILLRLKNFIQIIDRFGSLGSDGKSEFDIVITYDTLQAKNGSIEYVTTDIAFVSDILRMRMNGFRIQEFDYLSDDGFRGMFNVLDPVSIVVPSETIQFIAKISEINKFDSRRDMLVFYVEGDTLYVRDKKTAGESSFVYRIGELDNKPDYDIVLPVTREMFIMMTEKTDETFRLILGHEDDGSIVRLLLESTTTSTKIVIAGII